MILSENLVKLFYHFIQLKSLDCFFFLQLFDRYKDVKNADLLPYNVSREKAESLGVEFIPMEVSIKDTIDSLKEKNLISF